MREDLAHRIGIGRRDVFHLAAQRRPENADGRERAGVHDALDAALGRLDRLDAGDDLARYASAPQLARRVLHRLEERVLPDRLRLAGTEAREDFRILEFVAEREVIGSRGDEIVVFIEAVPRNGNGLHADEPADVRADRAHERLRLTKTMDDFAIGAIFVVIAGIEMREDAVRFVARRQRHLDDVRDPLARLLGGADVFAGRAELAGQRRRPAPVETSVRNVDAEVVALEDTDAAHGDV